MAAATQSVIPLDFNGKVAVITGASAGIGARTAVDFAKLGASVCITGRNEDNLKRTAGNMRQAGVSDDKILLVVGDVTKEDHLQDIIKSTITKFGQINILVNNAGGSAMGLYMDSPVEQLEDMMMLNMKSVYMLTQLAVPHLIKTKGSIVNVSSMASNQPLNKVHNYAVSKAALDHHSKMLALDLAPEGVRVNCVTPGGIQTSLQIRPGFVGHGMSDEQYEEFIDALGKKHPMGRIGQPEDVSRTIVFLASEGAAFITGSIIPVDGGWACTIANPF